MKSYVLVIGLMLVCIISHAQVNETLPDELFKSVWRQGETRVQFLRHQGELGDFVDSGTNRFYKIVSITKPNGNYRVIASYNSYYIHMVLGTAQIAKSNALMISYDPNNLYNNFDDAVQATNGKIGWLYADKP